MNSVIGLFRRESTTSGSAAGSDPCLAAQLTIDLQAIQPVQSRPISTVNSGRSGISGAGDRRSMSMSISAVTPIDESSENGIDPLGALIDFEPTGNYIRAGGSRARKNRRSSLLEMHG